MLVQNAVVKFVQPAKSEPPEVFLLKFLIFRTDVLLLLLVQNVNTPSFIICHQKR
jgi:hypothetical protein